MGPLLLFILILVWVFALIAVHEIGHFILGWIGGLPARDMKLRLLAFPQHVALRDGAEWISPVRDIRRYVEVTRRHFRTRAAAFAWVAGGMMLELLWTGAVCGAALLGGYREIAFWAACVSLGMYAINVGLMDLPWALRYRTAAGDTSGLWEIAHWPAVIFSVCMAASRILLVVGRA
jgi:hypothetical protein